MATYCLRAYGGGAEGLDEDTARHNADRTRAFGHITFEAWPVRELLRLNDRAPGSLPGPILAARDAGVLEFRRRSVFVNDRGVGKELPLHYRVVMRTDGSFTGRDEYDFFSHFEPLKVGTPAPEEDT